MVTGGLVAILSFQAVACGGPAGEANGADEETGQNEGKAKRLLGRARETNDPMLYRRVIERFRDTVAAEEAREELAGILLKESEAAIAKKDWSTAEERAQEAKIYASLKLTRTAQGVLDKIDDNRAAVTADEANALAQEGKCASALTVVAAPVRKKPRDRFKAALQKATQDDLVKCVEGKMLKELEADNVDAARAIIETPDATTALSEAGFKRAEKVLHKHVVKKTTVAVEPLLKDKKWKEAMALLAQMHSDGKLDKGEHELAVEIVQDAVLAALKVQATAAISAKSPADEVAAINAQIEIAEWKKTPDELQALLDKLKVAVLVDTLKAKYQRPKAMWAWGAVAVGEAEDHEVATETKLKHADKVYVVAKSKALALIAKEDPGTAKGHELFAKVTGWVDATLLKTTDTAKWLPPVDQWKGTRVWAPLRAPKKEYHLGVVKKVDGKDVTVTRLSDKNDVVVKLKDVRRGDLTPGLKVMAFCADKIKPEKAKIDKVVSDKDDQPKVKVICDKGSLERVDLASAITTTAKWLPRRRP